MLSTMQSQRRGHAGACSLDAVDVLVAKDMNDFSKIERENVLYDIHGVPDIPTEEPNKICQLLEDLDSEIRKRISPRDETNSVCASSSSSSSSVAFKMALEMSEAYVCDNSFRLRFLRAERFDVTRAATRLLAFFEQKLEIFGRELLTTDITMRHLEEEDMRVLNSGHLQLLPQKDRSGRTVFFHVISNEQSPRAWTTQSLMRVIFYLTMAAIEDEETQKNGLVGVVYGAGKSRPLNFDPLEVEKLVEIREALPARYASMHYCYTRAEFLDYINYERRSFDKHMRARCRLHEGSPMECQYELVSFGIPSNTMPVSVIGRVKTSNIEEWIRKRKDIEAAYPTAVSTAADQRVPALVSDASVSSNDSTTTCDDNFDERKLSNSSSYVCPTENDVLFGRGKAKDHPGNIRLHKIIDRKRDRYEIAEKWEKTVIAQEIVAIIKDFSGRFLKVDGDGWTEVDTETAREKVSHTFRSRRPKLRGGKSLTKRKVNR